MLDTPEKRLLEAIIRQSVKDYIKLNPSSDLNSAEFFENEGSDYKSAEDFLFNKQTISFGDWALSFEEMCLLLDVNPRRAKKFIFGQQIEY